MDGYEKLERLGQGSYGRVFKAKRKSDGVLVAIKEIDYSQLRQKDKQNLVNEVNILRKLQNPHIVTYLDRNVDRDKKQINIVMEYCSGGDLQNYIRETRASRSFIPEEQIWLTLSELALALRDCHCGEQVICHRDIKPGNIFINSEGHVKLGDFGLARSLGANLASTILGTPLYMAPEIIIGKKYNEKCDIWALGCVIYEMASLRTAFYGGEIHSLQNKIKYEKIQKISSRYSDALWKIINMMLEKNPIDRPSVLEILKFRNVANTCRISELKTQRGIIREKTKIVRTRIAELKAKEKQITRMEPRIRLIENEAINY